MQDKKCTKCKAKFKWFRKKKTCADCGKPFCKNCTAKIENTRICVGLCLIRHACHLLVQLIIYYHSLLYRLSRRAEGFWRGHGNVSWVGDCNEPALLLMRRGFAIVVRDPTFIYITHHVDESVMALILIITFIACLLTRCAYVFPAQLRALSCVEIAGTLA